MGKTSRKILFDFDSLIDTTIGYARYLQLHYPKMLAPWALNADLKTLCQARLTKKNYAMQIIAPKIGVKLCVEIFDEVYNDHYEELISLSPKVPQTKQIISIYDNPDYSNFMDCHLLGRDDREIDVLKKEFPNHTTFLAHRDEKFNYSQYARVFLGSFANIDHLVGTEFTKITVLSYADNFEVMKDDEGKTIRMINPEALTTLSGTNMFELLDVKY